MNKQIIFTPRKLARIALNFLGSIIIAFFIATPGFVLIRMHHFAPLAIEELHKRTTKFILELGKKPLSPQKDAKIQDLTQEIEELEERRLPLWFQDIFPYFLLLCSVLFIFVGFKMNILFIGLSFINSGLLLLYAMLLYFLYKTWEQPTYFRSVSWILLIILILGFNFAYISYRERKVKREKS